MIRLFLFFVLSLSQSLAFAQLVPVQTLFSSASGSSPFVGPPMAGGDSFGGGDNVDIRKHTAWFYGSDPISTCFHVTRDFGLTSTQIKSDLQEVIQDWKDYFDIKQINIKRDKKINTHFSLKDSCEGGESLVFYFGTGPIFSGHLDLRARQELSRPVAYVNKTHVSEDYSWSKGYIRFMGPEVYSLGNGVNFPIWNQNHSFINILKHEIGHVLGFSHIPDTIMDKGISSQQFVIENTVETKLDIDGLEELIHCSDCEQTYNLETPQSFRWKQIALVSDRKILFKQQGHSSWADIQSVVDYNEKEARLLSMFSDNRAAKSRPHVIFLKVDGKPLSLEFKKQSLILRSQGELVARYQKEAK